MNVVVDTNVVAYLLLRTEPFVDECHRFWRAARDVIAPSSWESEVVNVVWLAIRAGVVTVDQGLARLRTARNLSIRSVPTSHLWEGALVRAVAADHPAYDTLFIELAERTGRPLATFDMEMLRRFPGIAARPGELSSPSKG